MCFGPVATTRRALQLMDPAKVEPSGYAIRLYLETLIWTRGAKYPAGGSPAALNAHAAGGTAVEVAWLPGGSLAARAGRDLYQCVAQSPP